mmetsp:Transcript_6257/g.9089  ORF Transcript_6257/g.9089 Transcript_6257/m.9089 type:complete len:441 (+) Transcript_6257:39-1361(+)
MDNPPKVFAPQSSNEGKLVATLLTAYDLPEEIDTQPTSVSMSILDQKVQTGPPNARFRERNSFKFLSGGSGASQELSIAAPLSSLYPSTLHFGVDYDGSDSSTSQTLIAQCKLDEVMHINEPKWLILNLQPESKNNVDETSIPCTGTPNADENYDKKKLENGTTTQLQQPTLRLKLLLTGPYRPEISALIGLSSAWFRTVDDSSQMLSKLMNSIIQSLPSKLPSAKYLLIPTVPMAAGGVAFLPIILGVMVIGLPLFLPILVILLAICALLGTICGGVYMSTRAGRDSASVLLGPIYGSFIATTSGQRIIYNTGPRPSPVSLAQSILPNDMIGKLVTSLLIDFVGSSSYLLPVVGEAFDLIWAPTQTVLICAMYDSNMPSLKYISFLEEIIPFTDALPSATLGWVKQYSTKLLEESRKKVNELAVVARGEKHVISNGFRS